MPRVSPDFGQAVTRVLEEHNLSRRGAVIRTGLDHVTISRMASGIVPRADTVMQFARGFELDLNEWLKLAGYQGLPTGEPQSWGDYFLDLVRALSDEAGQPIPVQVDGGWHRIRSKEEAEERAAAIRAHLEADGLLKRREAA